MLIFQMNMTLSLNLKPLLWITPIFYTPQQRATAYNWKIHLQRGLELSLWGLELPVYHFVHTGMNPAVVLPQNQTLAFAALGIVGSSTCTGIKGGQDFQREELQLQTLWFEGVWGEGFPVPSFESFVVTEPVQVQSWDCFSLLPWPLLSIQQCGVMICVSSLETAIHVEPQDIHLLLFFCALKGYYFENHSLQQPLQRVTLSSSENRAELCTWFSIK